MKTFLSSTYADLVNHRKAAAEAVERLGHQVGHMEVFGARPEEPSDVCFNEIDQCELFIGIYAYRYGYIPDGAQISITEAEFDHARKLNKSVFCFLVDEDHPWPPKMIESEPRLTKLRSFKAKIGSQLVRDIFTTPDDLAFKVAAALGRYLSTLGNAGIVRPTSRPMENGEFFDRILSEITNLRLELQNQKQLLKRADHVYALLTLPSSITNRRVNDIFASIFNGCWIDSNTNTALYPGLVDGELIVPYCYGGDSELTGVFFDFRQRSEGVYFARFNWIDSPIHGFAHIEVSGSNEVTGGWWYSEEMPDQPLKDLARYLPRMNQMILSKQSQHKRVPEWVDAFFRRPKDYIGCWTIDKLTPRP